MKIKINREGAEKDGRDGFEMWHQSTAGLPLLHRQERRHLTCKNGPRWKKKEEKGKKKKKVKSA
jgi:hypothetical protein